MLDYHGPVYRPPSEGDNLIIQATLGCSFDHCTFCSMYDGKPFVARPRDAVFAHIAAARAEWPQAHRVFLADGDAMTLPTADLIAILDRLADSFPALQRVASYATPVNLLRKSPEELAALKARKLSLVYLGIESGADRVLRRVAKGSSRRNVGLALTKARAAGMKVSATVILGLGGRAHWREHIDETAALVNEAPPNFLSTLQLTLEPDAVARFLARWEGEFQPQDDAAILAEQHRLLAALDPPAPVIFRSNHASNCLPLAGTLPKDKPRLLAQLDEALAGARPLRPRFLRGL
ncbi:MAG: radical SAM protein [Alphaproteobacteria bacterium]|nr:radical SAM protein [Alphaproteobacteria bacterium]